jgi:hypothetical protein
VGRAAVSVAIVALAVAGTATGSRSGYQLGTTKACLAELGLKVSVETPVPASLRKVTPYGTLGGLVWTYGPRSGAVYIEFGKSPSEATAMRKSVLKVFGASAATAAYARSNVMFYTNAGFKIPSHVVSTVESCLK